METPIEMLKARLNALRYMSNTRGLSAKKREAKQMLPQFEQAVSILESALAENTPTSDKQLAAPDVSKSVKPVHKPTVCKHKKKYLIASTDGWRCPDCYEILA